MKEAARADVTKALLPKHLTVQPVLGPGGPPPIRRPPLFRCPPVWTRPVQLVESPGRDIVRASGDVNRALRDWSNRNSTLTIARIAASESLPTRPWQRPGFGCTLRHGDPGSAAPAIRTPHPSCTRLGRLRARLSTTAAHHNATLSGGAAPSRDVPRPSHRERSYGLRCAVVGGR
jgi:hypothetical protein